MAELTNRHGCILNKTLFKKQKMGHSLLPPTPGANSLEPSSYHCFHLLALIILGELMEQPTYHGLYRVTLNSYLISNSKFIVSVLIQNDYWVGGYVSDIDFSWCST